MKIVIVEQSRVGIRILSALLADLGHDTIAFSDGGDALEFLQGDEDTDVILTSLQVPTVSGLQLCWEARLLANRARALYVIAMSSTYDGPTLGEALDSGADDFIMKPPNCRELGARLRAAERLIAAQKQLIAWATRDPLTDLLNRRAFLDQASNILDHAVDAAHSPVVMILDIDHFKRVNDTYGHDVGDDVIRHVAKVLRGHCALCGRIGGEEFAFVVIDCAFADALAVAEAVRRGIADEPAVTSLGPISVTASIGLAVATHGEAMRTILKRADIGLYMAKKSGRNRVVDSADVAATEVAA